MVRSTLRRVSAGLVPAAAGLLISAAVALAAGELAEKAGTAGCVSETGTGGQCQDGRGLSGAAAMALSPDGENAYAASSGGDGIAVLHRDPATGALAPIVGTAGCVSISGNGGECQSGRGLGAAADVVVSPDGKSVYVAAPADGAVAVFSRSLATGELNQLPGAEGCVSQTGSNGCADGRALDGATSVIVSPDGQNVYVGSATSGGIAIFSRDPSNGAIDQVAGAAGCIDEDGSEGCADGDEQTAGLQGVAISPNGKAVYAAAQTRDAVTVYDRSVATGELIQKAGAAGCIDETGAGGCQDGVALLGADSIALSPDGENVYVAAKLSDAIAIFDRNPATNELTQKAGTAGCVNETGANGCQDGVALDEVSSVAVLPGGGAVYGAARLSSALTIFARNPADGALTQRPGTAGCISESGTGGACQDGRALATANQVTTSADGSHVYAAAVGSSAVSVFNVNASPHEEGPAEEKPPAGETPPVTVPMIAPSTTQGAAPPGLTAPRVRKEKGPKAIVSIRKAKAIVSFTFSSSPVGATFQCKLDKGLFKSCRSPLSVRAGVGKHTLTVRAVSSAGASAPATYSFTVRKRKSEKK